jgi:hypothetical protein
MGEKKVSSLRIATDFLSAPRFAKFAVRYVKGMGYAVFDPEGERASCFFHHHDLADARRLDMQAERDAALKRKQRPCMCCGRPFMSQGIHNRLCDSCRHIRDDLGDPVRPYIDRRRA